MRKLGEARHTQVFCTEDDSSQPVHYYIQATLENSEQSGKYGKRTFSKIDFQDGPIKEFGVNGCHNEDLLTIVVDRLEFFQMGDLACRENALAITKIQEALFWLNHRTKKRIDRGVEGTSIG